jgi:hypothetical protein
MFKKDQVAFLQPNLDRDPEFPVGKRAKNNIASRLKLFRQQTTY